MSTDTRTDEITLTDAANQRVLRVEDALRRGHNTQAQLMEHLGLPKTTLINTLEWMIEQGRATKHVRADRRVTYTAVDADRMPVRDVYPSPDRAIPRTPENASAMDTLTAVPSWLKALKPIPAQQGSALAPERPAAAPAARIRKGGQEELILAYLADHPRDSFGPYELGRALAPAGRKPLGVRDACARLAGRGQILQVSDRPVRYMHRMNTREA